MNKPKVATTKIIEDVVSNISADRIPIGDLVEAMRAAGFGLVMMVFALGIIIPLPPPFPSLISIPLVIFSLQMMMGYPHPILPGKFAKLSVKRSILATIVQKSSPYLKKVEMISRTRLLFVTSVVGEKIIGFFSLIFSLFILLPIPLSNFIPGVGVLIISFGLIGKDGIIVIAGVITGLFGVTLSISVLFLGFEVFGYLKHFFGM